MGICLFWQPAIVLIILLLSVVFFTWQINYVLFCAVQNVRCYTIGRYFGHILVRCTASTVTTVTLLRCVVGYSCARYRTARQVVATCYSVVGVVVILHGCTLDELLYASFQSVAYFICGDINDIVMHL